MALGVVLVSYTEADFRPNAGLAGEKRLNNCPG
jgi:hypothetical protein